MNSVCIPTYNGQKYVKEQLESILSQLSSEDEVIISDDGSTDDTISIVMSLADPRIKVIYNKKKEVRGNSIQKSMLYVSNNVQNALLEAKGDVIFLSDQDDVWLPGRVSETKKYFSGATTPGVVVVCDCKVVSSDKKILHESYFEKMHTSDSILSVIYKNPYLGCCMCFDRDILNQLFPFPRKSMGHDLWIGLVGKLKGKVYFLNKPLVLYRRHDSTVTTSGLKSTNSLFFKLSYRIDILIAVLKKIINKC